MEDRKTALAIFLCILVVMVYSEVVLQPYYSQEAQKQAVEVQANLRNAVDVVFEGAAGLATQHNLLTQLVIHTVEAGNCCQGATNN